VRARLAGCSIRYCDGPLVCSPDFQLNEVACDYNAGFQGAVAGLKSLSLAGVLGD
jgi:hypothetical protein